MIKEIQNTVEQTLRDLIGDLVPELEFKVEKEPEQYRVNIITSSEEIFLDEQSEFLIALQHIARVMTHKAHPKDRTHFILDVNSRRLNREKYLHVLIPNMAQNEVVIGGQTLILVGLNSYERMVVHNILKGVDDLETTSVGLGKNRKLLIRPLSEIGATGMENAKIIDIEELIKNNVHPEQTTTRIEETEESDLEI